MKKLTYDRIVLGLDGKSQKKASQTIEVEIKPGQTCARLIKFPGKGNEGYSYPTCKL